jgi:hypothetical protein
VILHDEHKDLRIQEHDFSELSFDALREKAGALAERRLVVAVLEDAVICYQRYLFANRAHEKRIFEQAETWLMRRDGTSVTDGCFSFEYICDALGLDSEGLRWQLRRWREQQIEDEAPFVSSRQRCRWRAVYREPYKQGGAQAA